MEFLLMVYEDEAQIAALSEDDLNDQLDDYRSYTASLQEAGVLRAGNALQPTSTAACALDRDGEVITLDGPFAETKEQLGGYYLIECKDREEALAWAAKMPAARTGRVEVRPIWNY